MSLVRQLFHVLIERFFGTAWMSYAKPELGVMLCVVWFRKVGTPLKKKKRFISLKVSGITRQKVRLPI